MDLGKYLPPVLQKMNAQPLTIASLPDSHLRRIFDLCRVDDDDDNHPLKAVRTTCVTWERVSRASPELLQAMLPQHASRARLGLRVAPPESDGGICGVDDEDAEMLCVSSTSKAEAMAEEDLTRALAGLPPAVREAHPLRALAVSIRDDLQERPFGAVITSDRYLLPSGWKNQLAQYPEFVCWRGRASTALFYKFFGERGESGDELFFVENGVVTAAGSAAAERLAAGFDTRLADTSMEVPAAAFELAHVRPKDTKVDFHGIAEFSKDLYTCLQVDSTWTDNLAAVCGDKNTRWLAAQLRLQQLRAIEPRPDSREYRDLQTLSQLSADELKEALEAKGKTVEVALREVHARLAQRSTQFGAREAADGIRSIEERERHQLHAADIYEEWCDLDEEERCEIANELYLELRHFAPGVRKLHEIAQRHGITPARLSEACGLVLQRQGKLPKRYAEIAACVFGVDGGKRAERGGSGEIGTYVEKDRSREAGESIGTGFFEFDQQVKAWEEQSKQAVESSAPQPPHPTYDALLGMVSFDTDGTPNMYALFAEGLTSRPWDRPSNAGLLMQENDLAGAFAAFYQRVGYDERPYCTSSSPPLPSSAERHAKSHGGKHRVIRKGLEWCSGGFGALASVAHQYMRGDDQRGKAFRAASRSQQCGHEEQTVHRHCYPVWYGFYTSFRVAGVWRGHEDSAGKLNTTDPDGARAAEAYLEYLRSNPTWSGVTAYTRGARQGAGVFC